MAEIEKVKTGGKAKAADATADGAAGAGAQHCRIDKCKRPYRAKGYCNVHYRRWRHGKLAKPRYKICTAEACRKPRAKAGFCAEHSGAQAPAK